MKHLLLRAPLTLTTAQAATLPVLFEGVAYGGGVVPAHGVVIDLASTAVAPRMPLLHEHVRDAIVGVVTTASISDSSITVAGRLFSDMPGTAAEKIGQLAQRGAPFQLSVGLYGYSERVLDAGQVAIVNGRTVSGPVSILRRGTVREVSIVTLGADYESSARLFTGARPAGSLNLREILARRRREAAAFCQDEK